MNKNKQIIPPEQIMSKIFLLRGEKVMLDVHLAEIYEVETRILKQAVRRNIDLFPDDFMFMVNETEIEIMVSQNVIPSKQHLGGARPFAFSETGVAMLSSVLKSKRAKEMNIAIMRAFVTLRKMLMDHTELHSEIEKEGEEVSAQLCVFFVALCVILPYHQAHNFLTKLSEKHIGPSSAQKRATGKITPNQSSAPKD